MVGAVIRGGALIGGKKGTVFALISARGAYKIEK